MLFSKYYLGCEIMGAGTLVHAAGMGGKRNEYTVLATKEHIASETWASMAISLKCILIEVCGLYLSGSW